jgi:hypothetical protein
MTYPNFVLGDKWEPADANAVGLWKVASTTFTSSAGVEMSNCFSSNYQNYIVQIVYAGSVTTNTQTQYMTGTNTKDTAANYNRFGFYWFSGINSFNMASTTSDFVINHSSTAADFSTAQITISNPNVSGVRTVSNSHGYSGDSGLTTFLNFNKATTTAYTGLYFFPSSGTITGTITVYGMRG